MTELETRKTKIEAKLEDVTTPPPLLHPNMAEVYHRKIRELHAAQQATLVAGRGFEPLTFRL